MAGDETTPTSFQRRTSSSIHRLELPRIPRRPHCEILQACGYDMAVSAFIASLMDWWRCWSLLCTLIVASRSGALAAAGCQRRQDRTQANEAGDVTTRCSALQQTARRRSQEAEAEAADAGVGRPAVRDMAPSRQADACTRLPIKSTSNGERRRESPALANGSPRGSP